MVERKKLSIYSRIFQFPERKKIEVYGWSKGKQLSIQIQNFQFIKRSVGELMKQNFRLEVKILDSPNEF